MFSFFLAVSCVCAGSSNSTDPLVTLPPTHFTVDCPVSYGRELLSSSCLGYVPVDKVDAWFAVMNSWTHFAEAFTLRKFGLPDLWNRKVYREIEWIVQDGEAVLYLMTLLTSPRSPKDWPERVRSFVKDPAWREKRMAWTAELRDILGEEVVDAILDRQRAKTSNPLLLSAAEN